MPTMTPDDLAHRRHAHVFDAGSARAERGTWWVTGITAVTMVVEIAAGWWFNSMALLADGWHMSSHAIALGLAAMAYATARRWAHDERFAFGTWKIEVLGGFASAVLLAGVAVMMVAGSVERLVSPQPIAYREAIVVAVLGLVVNLVCALILNRSHDHGGHGHGHGHAHGHAHAHDHAHHDHAHGPGGDLNLRAAYVHVLTDAATSVLAIAALIGGLVWGWAWLDPAAGLVGAVLVAVWARGLIGDTAKVLLDREMDHPVVDEIRDAVQGDDTHLTDLHVWRVGRDCYACAMTAVTRHPTLTPDDLRARLAVHEEIVHSTIELHRYDDVARR